MKFIRYKYLDEHGNVCAVGYVARLAGVPDDLLLAAGGTPVQGTFPAQSCGEFMRAEEVKNIVRVLTGAYPETEWFEWATLQEFNDTGNAEQVRECFDHFGVPLPEDWEGIEI